MAIAETLRIRKPTAVYPPPEAAPTFRVDKPVKGLKVGIRHDGQWNSWELIAELWAKKLAEDGAKPMKLLTGEHTGKGAEDTYQRMGKWAQELDAAVIGIGT